MKELKDSGISVISMQDLLAWRNGEKAIPSKSAVITIDEWKFPILRRLADHERIRLSVHSVYLHTMG